MTGKLIMKNIARTAGNLTLKGAAQGGRFIVEHRQEIGMGLVCATQAVTSAVKGAGELLYDTASLKLYSLERVAELKEEIGNQGRTYHRLIGSGADPRFLDSLAVGGDLLQDIITSGRVPADVQQAYELACPHEAAAQTFSEAAQGLDGQELTGFLSLVKGKLFELRYAEYLNNGHLPDGYVAHLAPYANQPGWDLAISGPDGHVADLLQLKAADSVAYVRHALEQYPHIDVVTTDEVYSHLIMTGAGEHVTRAGIENADLSHYVASAADAATVHMDLTPPVISLALIAFTSYRLPDADAYEKSRHFGARAGKSYLSYLVGGATAAVTQTWWLGVLAGVGSRLLAGKGRRQREAFGELKRLAATNRRLLALLSTDARASQHA